MLAVASIVFYAVGGGWFTLLMLASIAFNFWMAILVDRARHTDARRGALMAAVGVNVAVLALFKYADFAVANANAVLGAFGGQAMGLPQVLLPIGISFYTFHAISYVVDVYRGDATAQKQPVHAALYLLLFPQLIAGPIIRYREIADQLARRVVTLDDFSVGVRRFVIGLGKKMLIANIVAVPGRPDLRDAGCGALAGARVARRRVLHVSDLLRFLRLFGHGHRARAHVRLPVPGELPLAVRRRHACRSSGAAGT